MSKIDHVHNPIKACTHIIGNIKHERNGIPGISHVSDSDETATNFLIRSFLKYHKLIVALEVIENNTVGALNKQQKL